MRKWFPYLIAAAVGIAVAFLMFMPETTTSTRAAAGPASAPKSTRTFNADDPTCVEVEIMRALRTIKIARMCCMELKVRNLDHSSLEK